ncbi:MAG: bifunctional pyr operon transcriptional regulator/uracil phosphoribosyltransferase PyrR [Planctomycetota bacterium]
MQEILDASQVRDALDRLHEAVVKQLPDDDRLAVVGIRTRGETLAQRIVRRLREDQPERTIELGVLDVTFYRDDFSRRRRLPLVRATEIDFDLDDTWLLLVDDVLQTGRSIRAALDAIHDFGRPRVIRLAVLVDRGGRELPISADLVGQTVQAEPDQRVQVCLEENDGREGVYVFARS